MIREAHSRPYFDLPRPLLPIRQIFLGPILLVQVSHIGVFLLVRPKEIECQPSFPLKYSRDIRFTLPYANVNSRRKGCILAAEAVAATKLAIADS